MNTLKRWLENPISPISKILITLILSLLGVVVLVFFSETKALMLERLKASNSYEVYLSEQVNYKSASRILANVEGEEELWMSSFGAEKITLGLQPILLLKWKGGEGVPVIVYDSSFLDLGVGETVDPVISFLSSDPLYQSGTEIVEWDGVVIEGRCGRLPEALSGRLKFKHVLAVPYPLARPFLEKGFTVHLMGHFDSIDEVDRFVQATSAYYKAEGRRMVSYSAIDLLRGITELNALQNQARLGIVFCCGLILALILGSVAFLEYREESYLYALLRSFGTPRVLLLWHALVENIVLVAVGLATAYYTWNPLYKLIISKVEVQNLRQAEEVVLAHSDMGVMAIAAVLGVFLAMIPVVVAIRKPIGLSLQ